MNTMRKVYATGRVLKPGEVLYLGVDNKKGKFAGFFKGRNLANLVKRAKNKGYTPSGNAIVEKEKGDIK